MVLAALTVGTSMAWTGRLAPPGTFRAIPDYWHAGRVWLTDHNKGAPTPGRVLVVPGAPFATQVWGNSHDEPLQVLGEGPWGVRDSIPLTPAADHPGAGLRAAAVRRRPALGRVGGHPCAAGHLVCGGAQRSGPGLVTLGAPAAGAPRDRRLARAAEGRRVRRPGRTGHPGGVHQRQWTAPALPGGGDLSCWRPTAIRAHRIWPMPAAWPGSTAGRKCCCGSTNGAGCSASRRWVRCC